MSFDTGLDGVLDVFWVVSGEGSTLGDRSLSWSIILSISDEKDDVDVAEKDDSIDTILFRRAATSERNSLRLVTRCLTQNGHTYGLVETHEGEDQYTVHVTNTNKTHTQPCARVNWRTAYTVHSTMRS